MSTVEARPGDIFDAHNHTILIVDDEPANLAVVVDYLAGYGFQVKVAQTGETGLELARQTQPDLILLDVRLPGIDGLETCRRLQADEQTRDIPVIFMTIMTRVEDKVKGFAAGGVDYITKPFQYEEILARVNTHLRQRWLTRNLQAQNEQLQQAQAALRQANEALEQRVEERTAELTAERNLLRTVIDHLPDFIYVKDSQSRFVLVNTSHVQHYASPGR